MRDTAEADLRAYARALLYQVRAERKRVDVPVGPTNHVRCIRCGEMVQQRQAFVEVDGDEQRIGWLCFDCA